MALKPGTTLGPYQFTAKIGKFNRQGALKILPEAFASDPDRLARFQREAKVGPLNHPHIGAVHGPEESGAIKGLVEGPTLTERMHRRPASPNL